MGVVGQALEDARRRGAQLEAERDALRSGIAKRDEALALMKQELQRGAHMLSAATETREVRPWCTRNVVCP